MKTIIATKGTKQFTLWDDSFTVNKKRISEFCSALTRENLKINWACNTRFDLLNEDIIVLMKNAGCNNVELGVESGSSRILKLIKKGESIEKMKNIAPVLRKHNLYWSGFFMIGLPTETPEEIRMTIKLMKQLRPNYATFSVFTPYPGTELFEFLLHENIISKTVDWHLYSHQSKNNNFTGIISDEEFEGIIDEMSKAFDSNNHSVGNIASRVLSKSTVYLSNPSELLLDVKRYLNYIGVLKKVKVH